MKSLTFSFFLLIIVFNSCSQDVHNKIEIEEPLVTVIEIGSVKCIPCKKMQVVMNQVNVKYPEQVETVFYDVLTKEGKLGAVKYNINLIPTQVFLDRNNNEFFRHEGYFSFEELNEVIIQQLN